MNPDDCINVISVKVPASAIEPGLRERIAELTRERDEALKSARVEYQARESAEARERAARVSLAETQNDLAEARAALAGREKERDGWFNNHEAVRKEREDAREQLLAAQVRIDDLEAALQTDRIGGRVATDFLNARIRVLEDAIRTLAKVLP